MPTVSELQQNFPNPFNPSTTIPFTVAEHGPIELDVFDLLGRPVRSLVSGPVPAGDHAVIWDGSDESGSRVGSGVYLYRLRGHGVDHTRKLMLVE